MLTLYIINREISEVLILISPLIVLFLFFILIALIKEIK